MAENRGRITLGCLFTAAVLAVGIYHGYKFGMPYFQKMKLEDRLFETAEHLLRQDRETINSMVIEAAASAGVALEAKNISYREGRSDLTIEVSWSVPIETPLIKRTLDFKVVTTRSFSN